MKMKRLQKCQRNWTANSRPVVGCARLTKFNHWQFKWFKKPIGLAFQTIAWITKHASANGTSAKTQLDFWQHYGNFPLHCDYCTVVYLYCFNRVGKFLGDLAYSQIKLHCLITNWLDDKKIRKPVLKQAFLSRWFSLTHPKNYRMTHQSPSDASRHCCKYHHTYN